MSIIFGLRFSIGISGGSRVKPCGWIESRAKYASKSMNPHYNLRLEQRRTQRLVDQFNASELLWKKLEPRRRAHRKLLRRFVTRETLKQLDLSEFAKARPPQDCIGEWFEPTAPATSGL
jgi:hypothetical protein